MAAQCGKTGVPPVFYGYDLGTGGLTGQVRAKDGELLAEASADYGYGPGLVMSGMPKGVMLQEPIRWEKAMLQVSAALKRGLEAKGIYEIDKAYVGLVGQMHGRVRRQGFDPVPLWCDDGDAEEAADLTRKFSVKVAQRFTIARIMGQMRRESDKYVSAGGYTTPAGWLFHRLTGEWAVGCGEASGYFPVNKQGTGFDTELIRRFNTVLPTGPTGYPPLETLMPSVHGAGQFIGRLNTYGAEMLGLPVGTLLPPVEGDQQGALAGSLIGRPGEAAFSLGTSFVLNVLSEIVFSGISAAIDPFKTADGQDFSMIWVKNGATFFDLLMEHYRDVRKDAKIEYTINILMPLVEAAAKKYPDCRGLLGLPFLINEPGANFVQAVSMLIGLTGDNFKKEHLLHLALLLPLFGVRNGMDELAAQGIKPDRLVLTGGIMHSASYAGPMIAEVCDTEVFIPEVATEGTAYGAYVLARYAYCRQIEGRSNLEFPDFLDELAAGRTGQTFKPDPVRVQIYKDMRARFNGIKMVGRLLQKV